MRLVVGIVLLCSLFVAASAVGDDLQPVPVRVAKSADGWQLLRDGKPYFVRGVGGSGSMKLLAECGGNSVRTWSVDQADRVLDEAHQLGLTVMVGLWLGHERHGFDYNDADQVAKQQEAVRAAIEKYKHHPAVLGWGLGNEMEGYEQGKNAAIWSTINNLAALAKRLDPHHPTMTVTAEIGGDRVKNIHRLVPEIDIVGINSYGGIATLPERYRAAGGEKPYVVTEFGPAGSWETKKNDWGVAPEPTSTTKAEAYRRGYEGAVNGAKGLCLGSYAFLWGHKQEATATWFGMLLPDGSRLGAVDVMQELWTGKPPTHRCPAIVDLRLLDEAASKFKPGAVIGAKLVTDDPQDGPYRVEWVLQAEATSHSVGGDAEAVPPKFLEAIVRGDASQAEIKLPEGGGGYRLFAYVRDGHGGAAVANVPLYVDAPIIIPPASKATLPLVVYDEADRSPPTYIPAGWMGNTKGLAVEEGCTDAPYAGRTCLKVTYTPSDNWAGVVWQNPPQDWGDRAGGFDLQAAKKLTFWARGAAGGEVVTFEFGLFGGDKKFKDTGRGKLDKQALSIEWTKYEIDVAGQDLSRIKSGFAFVLAGQGKPVTFYLDDVQFE
jgi:hypothetical protein